MYEVCCVPAPCTVHVIVCDLWPLLCDSWVYEGRTRRRNWRISLRMWWSRRTASWWPESRWQTREPVLWFHICSVGISINIYGFSVSQDVDDFFEHEKTFLLEYHNRVKDASAKSDRMIRSHKSKFSTVWKYFLQRDAESLTLCFNVFRRRGRHQQNRLISLHVRNAGLHRRLQVRINVFKVIHHITSSPPVRMSTRWRHFLSCFFCFRFFLKVSELFEKTRVRCLITSPVPCGQKCVDMTVHMNLNNW